MDLEEIRWNLRTDRRNSGQLKRASSYNHIGGLNGFILSVNLIAPLTWALLQGCDCNSTTHWRFDQSSIVVEEAHDLPTRRESLWIVTLVLEPGQLYGPVGKLEAESIPSFAAPTLTYPTPFENDMFSSALTEEIAHGQPGVAAADDDGVNVLVHNASRSRMQFHFSNRKLFVLTA